MATRSALEVLIDDRLVGHLERTRAGYRFSYLDGLPGDQAVSLTMPTTDGVIDSPELHPVFAMNLPEGYVLERLRARWAKATPEDPMLLLARTSHGEPIGRLRVAEQGAERRHPRGENLETVLAYPGAERVFEALEHRYLDRSAVSGMQPKLLVPGLADARAKPSLGSHATLMTSEYIVKAAGSHYPGLAINEHTCMRIAREAGLDVPEFHLSNDLTLFVMRRFDRGERGEALCFEDFNALMGRSGRTAESKYRGSYEQAAQVIELFASPDHVASSLAQLFDTVALSCILGNGDAHLKNFGLLYTQPDASDIRLSPLYDLTNTTAYIPEDALALSLDGQRSFFSGRHGLRVFGDRCGITRPWERVERLIDAAETVLYLDEGMLSQAPHVQQAIRESVRAFRGRG
jgi:serine/threonine-protein kinase HipA